MQQEKSLSYVMDRNLAIPIDTGKIISMLGCGEAGKHTSFTLQLKKTEKLRVQRISHEGLNLSRNTVYEYMSYLEDAFALFAAPIYAKSVREQWRNPRKIYSVDVGFKTALDYPFSLDTGRIIENIAFLELRRKAEKIYYFKGKQEVDFYYTSGGKEHLLNVSYEIDSPATRKREISGLMEAMKKLSIKKGSIVTAAHKELIKTEAGDIHVIPLWEWLLVK